MKLCIFLKPHWYVSCMNTSVNGIQCIVLIPMMIGNIAAGNIAIRFDAQGPNLPVVTACATSTHAIGEAFRAYLKDFCKTL